MNIYLDIDGVLLTNDRTLAIGGTEFIKYAVEHFNVFWLTTHCMHGAPSHAITYVQSSTKEDLMVWLKQIRPTVWSIKKTEAIDFSESFLWFDDDCYSGERADIIEKGVMNSWIEVNLQKYPNQLVHELILLQSYVSERRDSARHP